MKVTYHHYSKFLFSVLICCLSYLAKGQTTPEMPLVLAKIYTQDTVDCHICFGLLNAKDSLEYCHIETRYFTKKKGVYYEKAFDLSGRLRAEGYVKKLRHHVTVNELVATPKKQPRFLLKRHGDWKFYDKNGYLVSNCCYENGNMCSGCH